MMRLFRWVWRPGHQPGRLSHLNHVLVNRNRSFVMSPEFKAVLFDMDDTLLDWSERSADWATYEQDHLRQVYDYVSANVRPLSCSSDEFCQDVRRLSRQSWINAELDLRAPSYGDAILGGLENAGFRRDEIDLNACLKAYAWQIAPGVKLFPEVPQTLAELRARGIEIGMITNASVPMWMRDHELEQCNLLQYFGECRLTAYDVGYIKPHSAIFLRALEILNLSPAEVVFVGDNPAADVAGAQKVGMRAVLRNLGYRSALVSMGEIIPDAEINSLDELLPLFDQWYSGWRG